MYRAQELASGFVAKHSIENELSLHMWAVQFGMLAFSALSGK